MDASAEHVDRLFRTGREYLVAEDRAGCFDLRVRVVRDDVLVVSGPSNVLRVGARVTRRAGADAAASSITLVVQEVEETGPGFVDAALLFDRFDALGAAGGAKRFSYDAMAMSRVVDVVSARGRRGAALRIVELSRAAIVVTSDDRYGRGESLDVAFTDEGGGMIQLRVTVAGPERATYGRVQHVADITAAGSSDARRLDELCSRRRLHDEAAAAPSGENAALRSLLLRSSRGRAA